MTLSAIFMMVIVQLVVACITALLFIKVLKTPPKPEPDSYSENDEDPR